MWTVRSTELVVLVLVGSAHAVAAAPDVGTYDARLTRLFTPMAAPAGIYQVFRSSRSIVELAATLRALDASPVGDAWKVSPLGPADAFGSEGSYDAPKLARLYMGSRPAVARGSLRTADGLVAYTLIAPWPDADLTALQPGTMVIVFHVTALTGLK